MVPALVQYDVGEAGAAEVHTSAAMHLPTRSRSLVNRRRSPLHPPTRRSPTPLPSLRPPPRASLLPNLPIILLHPYLMMWSRSLPPRITRQMRRRSMRNSSRRATLRPVHTCSPWRMRQTLRLQFKTLLFLGTMDPLLRTALLTVKPQWNTPSTMTFLPKESATRTIAKHDTRKMSALKQSPPTMSQSLPTMPTLSQRPLIVSMLKQSLPTTPTMMVRQAMMKRKQTTLKLRQSTMKPRQSTVKPRQSTVKPRQPTVKPRQATMKPRQATMKPRQATMTLKQAVVTTKVSKIRPTTVSPPTRRRARLQSPL
mmetsp:Transcript_7987/g.24716  ORF Transcript_7987/g.24716 Transcript_7987/m.24716 type:complete len:311 (-) Transcript_7987:538-1470(-)